MRLPPAPLPALALPLLVATAVIQAPQAPLGPRFTRVTEGPAVSDRHLSTGGVSWVDFDGDGDPDLHVTNGYNVSAAPPVPDPDRLFRNDGGVLVPVEGSPLTRDSAFSSGGTWGDMDNDGDLDAFVATQVRQPDLLFRNDGAGRFVRIAGGSATTTNGSSFSAAWIDADNDGRLDLAVFNGGLAGVTRNHLHRGQGDGTFTPVLDVPVVLDSAQSGGGVFADYDGDGDQDLFIPTRALAGPFTRWRHLLYRNDGGFRFTEVEAPALVDRWAPGTGAAWGDYDNDGDPDLYVAGDNGVAGALFRNDAGRFTLVDAGAASLDGTGDSTSPTWADFDNDGWLDLLVVKWGAAPSLYLNRGRGRFEPSVLGRFGDLGRFRLPKSSVATADYDGDGDLDIYMGAWPDKPPADGGNHLYRNDSPAGSWLQVRLEGTTSNRSAIGARVLARARIGGSLRLQSREVQAHTSWRSQSDLAQHFGLGGAARVEELEVRWPSGRIERCGPIPARQVIAVVEGRGWASWRSARGGGALAPCVAAGAAPTGEAAPAPGGSPARGYAVPGLLAITGVTVIPMAGPERIPGATVLVRDGRIAAVGPAAGIAIPAGARRVDGRGKFLLPGLADLHTHLYSDEAVPDSVAPDELGVLLATGITTARLMIGTPEHLALRREIGAGRLAGPQLFVASPQFTGKPAGNAAVVTTPAEARAAVQAARDAGYDFIKLTTDIARPVYDAVVAAAAGLGLRVAGHVDPQVGIPHALRAGQQLEHLDGYFEAVAADSAPAGLVLSNAGVFQARNWALLDHVDWRRLERLAGETARAGAWISPTLHIFNTAFARGESDSAIRSRPDWEMIPPAVRARYLRARARYWAAPATPARRARYAEVRDRLVKAISDSGGRILAGSDSPEWLMSYGWALHRELEALVGAGLTPRQALAAATTNAAEFFGQAAEWGSIAPGRRADLLLLEADPLADIRNTLRIEGVVVGGRWFDRAERARMIRRASERLEGFPPDSLRAPARNTP